MPTSIFRPDLFTNTVAIITGGGTGIGLTTARELGSLGAKVALCGRREEPLIEAASELVKEGIEVHHGTCDIRKPDTIEAFLKGVKDRLGTVDILVNNAGGQFPVPAQHLSANGFEAVVRNNLLGTWNFTSAVAKMFFIPQKRGRIVNITAQVERGFPGMIHTGAARAGVQNMTKTFAIEWAQFGIRVNAVAPGVIKTSGTDQYPAELLKRAGEACLARRLGHPQEIGQMVVYLASAQADFITGQTFVVDGGQSLWGEMWPLPEEVPQYPPYVDEGR